jgi:16S rRNA processing protein RimM
MELGIGKSESTSSTYTVTAARFHGDRLLARLEGLGDRNSAELLRSLTVFVRSDQLPVLESDTYWEHDLVGMEVFDIQGNRLGAVTSVIARAEQDLWEIDGEILLPAAKNVVIEVNLDESRVVVDPPEGLITL